MCRALGLCQIKDEEKLKKDSNNFQQKQLTFASEDVTNM
jgi:hypothetical protein